MAKRRKKTNTKDHSGSEKEETLVLNGVVTECLPQTKFRVELETGQEIIAYNAGRLNKFRIKITLGDKVQVELSLYDLTQGRIIRRDK
ncbi:translation initiation factor IF-1 [bacterium]|nr:translation initiation factor IF-1 [bacterium]